jgi:tripartite-type tricarboxylate transporter receptor subunit TctC
VKSSWEAGKLTVIGVGSTERLPQIPNIPTLAESGLPGYEAGSWYGLAAPKGTPRDIVDKLAAATQRIFADPSFRDRFLTPHFIYSIAGSPAEFAARIQRDSDKWGKVIKDAGVKVE